MTDKVKIPEFIKDGAKAAMEPLSKLEDRFSEMIKKISDEKVSKDDVKKAMQDALKWVKGARTDIEKTFSDGMGKTLTLLNLPSRDEVKSVQRKINKLAKDVKAIEEKVGIKPVKKPTVKKATKKATVKKVTTKKAVKK